MALRAAPTPIARLRGSTAPTGPSLRLLRGPGMTPAAVADEQAMELAVLRTEALTFVDRARPHARTLEWATRELTPSAHQHALALLALIEQVERRWTVDGGA